MFYDNDFEIRIGMKKFYSVHILEKEKNHNILDLGYVGFETKEEMSEFIDKVKEENAYVFFNIQKIKIKYSKVKAF